jgi:hypothetical protein
MKLPRPKDRGFHHFMYVALLIIELLLSMGNVIKFNRGVFFITMSCVVAGFFIAYLLAPKPAPIGDDYGDYGGY